MHIGQDVLVFLIDLNNILRGNNMLWEAHICGYLGPSQLSVLAEGIRKKWEKLGSSYYLSTDV